MPDLLTIERLSAGYGEAVVLSNVSLSLVEGKALALLGRNGMGKTTLINTIVGVTRRFGGTIALDGADITALRPEQRAHAGVGWVPVDLALAITDSGREEDRHFGNDPGDFVVMNLDQDVVVNSPLGGRFTAFGLQNILHWYRGSRSIRDERVQEKWQVRKEPLASRGA